MEVDEVPSVFQMLYAGEMDFVGQTSSYSTANAIMITFTFLGFVYGLLHNSFIYCFYSSLAGALLATLLCVPSWPVWNRNALPWQPASDRHLIGQVEEEDEEESNTKLSRKAHNKAEKGKKEKKKKKD